MSHVSPPSAPPRVRVNVDEAYFRCTSFSAGRDGACVSAIGEHDIASAPELERVLDEAQTQAGLVVLDLHELEFIDTTGVHVVVEASRYARIAGHRLVVLRGPQSRDVFDVAATIDDVDIQRFGIWTA